MVRLAAEKKRVIDLIGYDERLMPAEVPEASEVVTERLPAEGVRLHLGVRATKVDGSRQRLTLSDSKIKNPMTETRAVLDFSY
jgi:pyruvate/2-oxoglutarate dehydrogenase complex dihydrolipoamide dehydrogenase (E3) component